MLRVMLPIGLKAAVDHPAAGLRSDTAITYGMNKAKAPLHPLGQHFYLSWFVTSDRGVPFVANRLAAHLWPHQAAVLKSLSA